MLALISPAKKLDFESPLATKHFTQPDLIDDAAKLANKAKRLSSRSLQSLMGISEKLADVNVARFKAFAPPFTTENARPAALTFAGDTYVGLDAHSLNEKDLAYAQDHLRILSGLYGLLRPLDLIQAYRLEMGTKFAIGRNEDLYGFWDTKITDAVNDAVAAHKNKTIINLASNEYAKAIKPKGLVGQFVTPAFREEKDGRSRVLGLYAKRARGMMARYMIENRIEDEDGLKAFSGGGYQFQADQSTETQWVFSRPQP